MVKGARRKQRAKAIAQTSIEQLAKRTAKEQGLIADFSRAMLRHDHGEPRTKLHALPPAAVLPHYNSLARSIEAQLLETPTVTTMNKAEDMSGIVKSKGNVARALGEWMDGGCARMALPNTTADF